MVKNKKSKNKKPLSWLMATGKGARIWILATVAIGFASGMLLIIQAHFIAQIIHGATMEGLSRTDMLPAFMIILAAIAVRSVLAWAKQISGFNAGVKVRSEVRMKIMAHLLTLGPTYTGSRKSGALATTAMEQVEGLHDFFALYLPQMALAVSIPAAICAAVFPFSWAAGGILLLTAPLIPLFMILVGMGAESISQRHFQALSRLSGHFLDVLNGLTTLKLFDQSRSQKNIIERVSADYRKKTMSVLRIAFLSSAVLEFFSAMAIALVAVYLAMRFLGYIEFGNYGTPLLLSGGLFILLLAPDFYLPLRELGAHYHARAQAIGAASEIMKVLSIPPESKDYCISKRKIDNFSRITFRDVRLTYGKGQRSVLEGVSFQLSAGEKIAMTGRSGAGKTSIINLILRFTPPDKGQIRIDNTPLADLDEEYWRKQVAWIGQEPVLFYGSVRDNIRLGRLEASEEQIIESARAARVLDFCRDLPSGLDTMVGEKGFGLSRGQAQRVALARAFLKDAPLLLLDEPTAGLDSYNERLVMDSMNTLSRGRTVVMVSHRVTDHRDFDRILFLDNGKITESRALEMTGPGLGEKCCFDGRTEENGNS